MASTNPGKFASVRHSLIKGPSCSVGKFVSALALPNALAWLFNDCMYVCVCVCVCVCAKEKISTCSLVERIIMVIQLGEGEGEVIIPYVR